MLHGVVAPPGERVHKHVISIMSSSEPEPNRSLRFGKPSSPPPKTASTPPPSSQASSKSRITLGQHAVATRKVEQFMNSIVVRPVPVGQQFASLTHHDTAVTVGSPRSNLAYHSLSGVVHSFHALLELENEEGDLESDQHVFPQLCSSSSSSSSVPCSFGINSNFEDVGTIPTRIPSMDDVDGKEELEIHGGLMSMPQEIILAIVGHIDDNETRLQVSRVCKPLRETALADSVWKQEVDRLASECNIRPELLSRIDSTPKYLRYCAIARWYNPYREAKELLDAIKTENRPITDEKERFEAVFNKMMPNVSPWSSYAYYSDEIEFTLPASVSILPSSDSNTLHICVKLESGAFRHELIAKGMAPELEFMLYDPVGAHPAVTCLSRDVYHPLLNSSSNRLFIDFPTRLPSTEPASVVKDIILQVRDLFTRFDSIVSDFLL